MIHKCVYGDAPDYLKSLIHEHTPARTLRSTHERRLVVPTANQSTVGNRAFSIAGARLWNDLPISIRNVSSLEVFKDSLFQSSVLVTIDYCTALL